MIVNSVSGILPSLTTPNTESSVGAAGPGGGIAGVESFGEALAAAGRSVAGDLQAADRASMAGIRGEAGIREVADAVMSAEQSLQAAIAVRDKMVSAWMEISRMSI